MKHEVFTLKGDEMQIFDSYPFTIIADCDGTELVYIRRQIHDDTKCDVVYCGTYIYQYANWSQDDLERWVGAYCFNALGRRIETVQYTSHLILPKLDISDYAYGVNQLNKLTR